MKKLLPLCMVLILLLSGCTFTFGGTVMLITIRDLILYVMVAFVLAAVIAFVRPHHKRVSGFWIGFVLGILLTPLASFIYLLIMLSRKMNRRDKNNNDIQGN
jgi:hypothetical protein